MGMRWYVIRVQSGREERVRTNLIKRVKQAGLEHRIGQVVLPSENVTDLKGGKRKVTKKKIYPGYLLVEMDLDENVWFLIRETPGFGDFVGSHQQPTPMTETEVRQVLGEMEASKEKPKLAVTFGKGDRVKIKQGPFENFDGAVEEVNPEKGMIKVVVTIFGRATPVELGYWEVEPV
jgi:transcriptional antiterminator NusG